jgi:hypothetical protein
MFVARNNREKYFDRNIVEKKILTNQQIIFLAISQLSPRILLLIIFLLTSKAAGHLCTTDRRFQQAPDFRFLNCPLYVRHSEIINTR